MGEKRGDIDNTFINKDKKTKRHHPLHCLQKLILHAVHPTQMRCTLTNEARSFVSCSVL